MLPALSVRPSCSRAASPAAGEFLAAEVEEVAVILVEVEEEVGVVAILAAAVAEEAILVGETVCAPAVVAVEVVPLVSVVDSNPVAAVADTLRRSVAHRR